MSLKNPVTPPGIDPGTVRLVAQRLNHYASPGRHECKGGFEILSFLVSWAYRLDNIWPHFEARASSITV